jgi:hypothetical protein
MHPPRRRKWPATILGVAVLLASVWGMWVVVGGFIKEWRSGAAFVRYKNWRGLLVSHADALVFAAVTAIVMVLGALWSIWDRGRERRLAEKIARGRRAK